MPLDDQNSGLVRDIGLTVLDQYENLRAWLGTDWLGEQARVNFRRGVGPLVELLYLVGRSDAGPEVNQYFTPTITNLDRLVGVAMKRWPDTLGGKAKELVRAPDFRNARRAWWAFVDELACFQHLSSIPELDSDLQWTEGDGPDFNTADWDFEVTRFELEARDFFEEKLKTSDFWTEWSLTLEGAPSTVQEADTWLADFRRDVRGYARGTGFTWQRNDFRIKGSWEGRPIGLIYTTNYGPVQPVSGIPEKIADKLRQKTRQANAGRKLVVAIDMQDVSRYVRNDLFESGAIRWPSAITAVVPFWLRFDTFEVRGMRFHSNPNAELWPEAANWFAEMSGP